MKNRTDKHVAAADAKTTDFQTSTCKCVRVYFRLLRVNTKISHCRQLNNMNISNETKNAQTTKC